MTLRSVRFIIALPMALSGCSTSAPEPVPSIATISAVGRHALQTPARVVPGRLEYAPDGWTLAPILTERFPYPTQTDANAAYLRLISAAAPGWSHTSAVRLFGCKPGALDAQTARVTRYRGPVVHCATDLLDGDGRRLRRETVNFYFHRSLWTMQPVAPPRAPVAWRDWEGSPRDPWWWLPGRARYQ
ncbi:MULTISPECIES: hypothetical protein [unclassified Bosea (in: a-proteobacteria)]|uniref:hypothetical protein n=1 Tax=unclassified Bosea (in: a-proteobacteria) TaxID=2653178 RepID=UPI000F760AC3|nr:MULTISPECIES: hypothetical protein [unclassified Bosea (in: a-proteobacteria)]AZO82094.1 hypothetical protein BLM15_30375 [Bosea sp. Tri-49]RXT24670.1 hypothetical protein B5U98_08500 [Bosea sp. Tri-39]RXT42505.1 hypothetical protein B5U99_00970 [Bosea sp. Tri-54]